jgi:hypothetical protein
MAAPSAAADGATEIADRAVDHYVQRFPPILVDRDDDLEALREERDVWQAEAEAYEQERHDALAVFADFGIGPNQSVAECARSLANYYTRQMRAADDIKAGLAARAEKAEAELAAANAAIAEVARVAIVPQSKPERVEPGQRWARLETVADAGELQSWERTMMLSAEWVYLGPAPTTEG